MIYINERIKNSYTTRQLYYKVRKVLKIDEKTFNSIIKTVNGLLADRLTNGMEVNLPCKMGRLELRKFKTKVKFEEGKLITNKPIDWKETLKLWKEDEEAKEKKILVRHDTDFVFRTKYDIAKADYTNKGFYKFSLSRNNKRKIRDNINKGTVDAFEMK